MSSDLTNPFNGFNKRLRFGVPLKSILPYGEVHSNLKHAFWLSYKIAGASGYAVSDLLTLNLQGTLDYRLKLKDKFESSISNVHLNTAPGAIFWVIRHFIGLLPTPLMPRKIGDQKCVWKILSFKCRKHLANYFCKSNEEYAVILNEILCMELLHLPPENFVFLATFLNLLRMLSTLPFGEPKFNKVSAIALVRYFTSALLVRPFRPGSPSKAEKMYYPLIFYLILEWNNIRCFCITNGNYTFSSSEESYQVPHNKISKQILQDAKHLTGRSTVDYFTQTMNTENVYLVRVVPQSYYGFDYLTDVGCQTNEKDLQNRNGHKCCCCCRGSHDEKTYEQCELIFKAPSNDKNLLTSNTSTPLPDTFDSSSFLYDDCSKFDLVCTSGYENVNPFIPVQNIDPPTPLITPDVSAISRIYTSSPHTDVTKNEEVKAEKLDITPIGWNIPSQNAYQPCYDVQRKLNNELKLKFKQMKINKRINDDNFGSGRLTGSEINLLEKTKIKSKLDFLKIFNTKKQKAKKSYSCEHVYSKVKYERMGSISSFL